MKQKEILRCCQICKEKSNRIKLVRLVNIQNEWHLDLHNKLPGRGYYFCLDKDCLKRALTKGFSKQIIGRNFSENEADDFLTNVFTRKYECLLQQIKKILTLGHRSKFILKGSTKILSDIRLGKCKGLLLAKDASARTSKDWKNTATYYQIPLHTVFTKQELGDCGFLTDVSCLAVIDSNLWQGLASLLIEKQIFEDNVLGDI